MNDMARVEWAGDEQVVRLPAGYRVDAAEVRVTRDGNRIVLEAPDGPIDSATGLPMVTLLRLLDEGLEGEDEPFDADDIKRRGRERLAARSAVG
jgi:virulence-associated protein VagC